MSLPEKEFFPLDEIIDRWRFARCDRATLLDYARRDLLIFSVYLRELGSHQRVRETEDRIVTTTTTTTFSFRTPDYEWHSIRYLKAEDARRILECHETERAGVSVLYSSPSRDKASGTGYLQAHYFTPSDLLVTKAERDRFEREHNVNLSSGRLANAWLWLCDATNQKALAIIGSVLTALAVGGWTVYSALATKMLSP